MKCFPSSLLLRLLVGACLLAPVPAVRAQTPQSAPNLTPRRPHATSPSTDEAVDLSVPVATVNGVAVYRPLLRSVVSSPVDRALLIFAYHKSGLGMSAGDKDLAVRQYEMNQFQGSDQRLDAKLKTLNATRDDYRQYAVEETRIREVLRSINRGARSQRQAQGQQAAYLAQLRRDASINTARP